MDNNLKRLTKSQQKKLLKRFLISVGITLAVCLAVIGGLAIAYNKMFYTDNNQRTEFKQPVLTEEEKIIEEEKVKAGLPNKTVAVFGVDQDETRTDVILVVNFNTINDSVHVLSIPRDTKVIWTERQRSKYSQLTGYDISKSKLNEMYNYGRVYSNPGNIYDFTIDEIQNILGVEIDNYVVINIEAFNKIVDTIGGVEVDVPERLYYTDKIQGLYIDLYPGLQTLDGKQAEGLVRYRQYLRGDEDRIEIQHLFLTALAKQVLSSDTIGKLPSIVTTVYPYIKTDVKINEVFEYLTLIGDFNLDNLSFATIPGVGEDIGEGTSYFYIDREKLVDQVDEIFSYSSGPSNEENTAPEAADLKDEEDTNKKDENTIEIDKEVSIEVYNATDIKGIAGKMKETLEAEGYKVSKIDNYDEKSKVSYIYAKDTRLGKQFSTYIEPATIVKDTSLDTDIVIVMGDDSIE